LNHFSENEVQLQNFSRIAPELSSFGYMRNNRMRQRL